MKEYILKNPFFYMIGQSWHYAKEERERFILFVVLSILAHIICLMNPYVMGEVFNAIQTGGEDVIRNIMIWLLLLGLIELMFWLFHGPSRVIERNIAFNVRGKLFDKLYAKLRVLPLKWHQDHHSGNTINRIRKAGDALYDFTQVYFIYIGTITQLFGPVFVLLYLSWPVAAIALTINIVTLTALWKFDQAIIRWLDKENDKEHIFSATLFDYVSNFTTIITLRLGLRTQKELEHRYSDVFPMFKPHVVLNEWKYFVLNMGAAILVIFVILVYIGNELSQNGLVMVGTAVAVYRYLDMLRHSFFGFAGMYQEILKQHTDYKSALPIMEAEACNRNTAGDFEIPEDWKRVHVSNLDFSHKEGEVQTIQNLNVDLKRGERIALIGESGSGKSTLMALLRGLYEPQNVSLEIDAHAYETLLPLRELTTLMPQEPEIFENTVAYNITVGIDYPEDEVLEAVRLACFNRVLKRLPNGLETDVREKGVTLSGGERQRLALARGILAAKNSSIILMDEPTSSVDTHNEMVIYDHIFPHFKDCTIISSIHRLHLLGKFDRVIVMDAGQIIQTGMFETLKKEKGLFQTLWNKYQQSAKTEDT